MALYMFQDGEITENTKDISPLMNLSPDTLNDRHPLTAGIFTTILVREKIPIFLEEHLQRLFGNARDIELKIDITTVMSLEKIINSVIGKGDGREYGIRPTLWNLYDDREFNINKDFGVYSFNIIFKNKWYSDGIKASLTGWPREQAHIKSVFWTNSLSAEMEAKKRGSQEAIFVDNHGIIYEGARSNVFWIYEGTIETPKAGILKGVTRSKLLEICQKEGIKVNEGRYTTQRLLNAEEAFISGTTKKIIPVVEIDSNKIGNGRPGELTKHLMVEYKQFIKNYISAHRTK